MTVSASIKKPQRNPQLNKNGELIHLLSIEGLPRDILTHILDTAANFVSVSDREVKKARAKVAVARSAGVKKARQAKAARQGRR